MPPDRNMHSAFVRSSNYLTSVLLRLERMMSARGGYREINGLIVAARCRSHRQALALIQGMWERHLATIIPLFSGL
jgi:hypothetical protein